MQSFSSDLAFNIENAIGLMIQLVGEELYKVFMLILLMAVIYRISKNRRISMVIAVFITLMIFGAAHEG
ncbi:hypothetical protein [Methanobrevibacter sp.]|uniref:hypothetical protein n=1 Tax=Methanobrevibacter sp. TaxID=66852 RepID=UPI00388F7760